jgi:hypothetical protein
VRVSASECLPLAQRNGEEVSRSQGQVGLPEDLVLWVPSFFYKNLGKNPKTAAACPRRRTAENLEELENWHHWITEKRTLIKLDHPG